MFEKLKEAVKLERNAEIDFYTREIINLSGKEREKKGRALLNCKLVKTNQFLGTSKLYKIYTNKDLKNTEFSIGDIVLLSVGNPLKGIEAVIVEKRTYSLLIAVDSHIPKKYLRKKIRVDLFVNDVTFQRMLEAIKEFEENKSKFDYSLLITRKNLEFEKCEIKHWYNKNLNEFQKDAILFALSSKNLAIIHGPPGTGKTTVATELILQEIEKNKKVLVSAPSNIAVDNILEKISKYTPNIVRIGHPARISKHLLNYSLDFKVKEMKEYREVEHLFKKIEEIEEEQERFLKPIAKYRRGLSNDEILLFAEKNYSLRGLNKKIIRSMASWIILQNEKDKLYEKIKEKLNELNKKILTKADVVFTTFSTAGSEILKGFEFDVLVVDEATQGIEPGLLIPLAKSKKLVLIGDHKQLPPTILSEKAKKLLEPHYFERIVNLYPKAVKTLRIQYRMNEKIAEFPNNMFYNGILITDEKIRNIKLSDIIDIEDFPFNDAPIVFINLKSKEEKKKGSTSKRNKDEAKIVSKIVKKLISLGLDEKDLGIITPYEDQRNLLRNMIPYNVEISTVDGFQGREKEVIILSLVRANEKGEIGFLKDYRRLNVSLTRAKRKLFIIGNKETLMKDKVYSSLIKFLKSNGFYLDTLKKPL